MNIDEKPEKTIYGTTGCISNLSTLDSCNEQTDTEMHSAKEQKYGKPIQFGHVLPYWYGYLVLLSTTNILSKSSVWCC